jgi:hypothetical protein
MAFADTFYFVAVLNPEDQHHVRACQLQEEHDFDLVTTRAVLLEVGDAFADASTRGLAAELLHSVEADPRVEIVSLDDALYRRGLELYVDRPDKSWSLTDCISFVVMTDRGLSDALTGDRHFAQAGFVPLLAQV